VDNQVQILSDNHPHFVNLNKQKEKEIPEESTKKDDKIIADTQKKIFVPKASFSQRLQANRKKKSL